MKLEIISYSEEWEKRWDRFVLRDSVNGTFLQTRGFLNYHPSDRFIDVSILILQGSNIVAVVPACMTEENGKKCFFSHKGSTFGGIIIHKEKYNITALEMIFPLLENHLRKEGFQSVYIKSTSDIFTSESGELMDYYFYKNGYQRINELNFFIETDGMSEIITDGWSSGHRRHCHSAEKSGLVFRELNNEEELLRFYRLLEARLSEHGVKPVHTISELKQLEEDYIPENVSFYGVFYADVLIAGTMLFSFGKRVLHTQYLAHDTDYNHMYPMFFLKYHVMQLAREQGYRRVSFGISTEEHGLVLNQGLSLFKEGFGAKYCNNRSYYKDLIPETVV